MTSNDSNHRHNPDVAVKIPGGKEEEEEEEEEEEKPDLFL